MRLFLSLGTAPAWNVRPGSEIPNCFRVFRATTSTAAQVASLAIALPEPQRIDVDRLLALVTVFVASVLIPGCEEPSIDDAGATERAEPYDALAENMCGDVAWCEIDECGPLWGAIDDHTNDLSGCVSNPPPDTVCTEAAMAFLACLETCDMIAPACADGDVECRMARSDWRNVASAPLSCITGGSDLSCEDSIAVCDDLQDFTP